MWLKQSHLFYSIVFLSIVLMTSIVVVFVLSSGKTNKQTNKHQITLWTWDKMLVLMFIKSLNIPTSDIPDKDNDMNTIPTIMSFSNNHSSQTVFHCCCCCCFCGLLYYEWKTTWNGQYTCVGLMNEFDHVVWIVKCFVWKWSFIVRIDEFLFIILWMLKLKCYCVLMKWWLSQPHNKTQTTQKSLRFMWIFQVHY